MLGGIVDVGRLPPQLLPHLSSDEARELEKLANQGESVESLLAREKIMPKTDENSIRFTHNDMETIMWEVLRGDFSGDGYEQLLISKYERTTKGTYGSSETLILSGKDEHSKFEIARLSECDFVGLLTL